jgi:hypothetical protein
MLRPSIDASEGALTSLSQGNVTPESEQTLKEFAVPLRKFAILRREVVITVLNLPSLDAEAFRRSAGSWKRCRCRQARFGNLRRSPHLRPPETSPMTVSFLVDTDWVIHYLDGQPADCYQTTLKAKARVIDSPFGSRSSKTSSNRGSCFTRERNAFRSRMGE